MKEFYLENEKLKVKICGKGAELRSIYGKEKGLEYLWNADPKYWARSSPLLFPFIGRLNGKKYRHNGVEYDMEPHGFVKDMEFEVSSQSENEVWLLLQDTEETFAKYPFHFCLKVGYLLDNNILKVMWKVENTNNHDMHFSIGGHPAFSCPLYDGDKQTDYFIALKDKEGNRLESFVNTLLAPGGLTSDDNEVRTYPEGLIPITEDLFDVDTLVIEKNQVGQAALVDSNKNEYLNVKCDTPLLCIWSPTRKNAPFVCLEPWYGRCDCFGYEGELKDREYGNTIAAGEVFEAEYMIEIL